MDRCSGCELTLGFRVVTDRPKRSFPDLPPTPPVSPHAHNSHVQSEIERPVLQGLRDFSQNRVRFLRYM